LTPLYASGSIFEKKFQEISAMLNRDELDLLAARLFHMLRPHLNNPAPKWMSLNEACTYAGGMSRETLSGLIDEGHVYAKRIKGSGSKIIVDRETIDVFLNIGRLT
jgi:hypothetical protein